MNFEAKPQSLLTFRVGPVLCCAPSFPVRSIITPPKLTHPPGSDSSQPGIFKHGSHIVKVFDLRQKFGVELSQQTQPGNLIIAMLESEGFAFWVDQILDVFDFPSEGWGDLPPAIPRGVFSRTLLLNKKIHLYSEFEKLATINDLGYLKHYIQQLTQQSSPEATVAKNKETGNSITNKKPEAQTTTKESAITASAVHKADENKAGSIPDIKKVTSANDKPAEKMINTVSPSHKKIEITPSVGINKTATTTGRPKTAQTTAKPDSTSTLRTDKPIPVHSTASAASRPELNKVGHTSTIEKKPTADLKKTSANTARLNTTPPLNTTSSSNTSSPAVQKTAQQGTDSSVFGIILLFLLFLGAIGAGTYYLLLDDTKREVTYKKEMTTISPAPRYEEESTYDEFKNDFSEVEPISDELNSSNIDIEEIVATKEDENNLLENTIESAEMETPPAALAGKVEAAKTELEEVTPAQVTAEEDSNVSQPERVIKKESDTPLFSTGPDLLDTLAYRAEITKLDDEITITLHQTVSEEKQQPAEAAIALEAMSVEENKADETLSSPPPAKTLKQKELKKEVASKQIIKEVIHIVVKGDTLWAIAKKYVNNPFLYPELARLSNIKNPHRIYPGNRVRIRFVKN